MDNQKKHLGSRVGVYAVIWLFSYLGSFFALRSLDVPREAGIMLVIVTGLAFAVFIYKYYRNISFMDEVQVRVQIEAVVIAFSLALLLVMILGLLDLVVLLNKENWGYRHITPVFVIFYFIGLFISKRKYSMDDEKHD
ncbi:MAG: hypothetical protein ABWZ25_08470 [Chitinophagaceae bacterium]